jgi:porphobilinogen synthase
MIQRPRRLRRSPGIRKLVRETTITVNDLIYPLFIIPGKKKKEAISSMPGQFRYTIDMLKEEMKELISLGIKAVIIFGLTNDKDEEASEALNPDGTAQQAIQYIKKHFPDVVVITDVCVCSYTTHGHCGIIHNGYVDNDSSIELLASVALSHARAGADIVAPSAMLDGQIKAIRTALDANGFKDIAIMSYAAKYQSAFYGPFREAADSSPQFGDRASYQMDYGNSHEAMREMEIDVHEGADFLMVKPALAFLDIIRMGKDRFNLPMVAYNVSGEYAMIKAASKLGWLDETKTMMESVTAIKRAGADIIITYFAKDIARFIQANPY